MDVSMREAAGLSEERRWYERHSHAWRALSDTISAMRAEDLSDAVDQIMCDLMDNARVELDDIGDHSMSQAKDLIRRKIAALLTDNAIQKIVERCERSTSDRNPTLDRIEDEYTGLLSANDEIFALAIKHRCAD